MGKVMLHLLCRLQIFFQNKSFLKNLPGIPSECQTSLDPDQAQLFVLFVFVLRLNNPVNNFSAMSGRSHRFLGITSTFGE